MKKKPEKRETAEKPQPKFAIIDRRHKFDETTEAKYERQYPTFVEQLQQRLAAKDKQLKQYMEQFKQENDAYKQRLEREAVNRLEREKAQLLSKLLPVLDNLGRALASAEAKHSYDLLLQGLRQVMSQFWGQLQTAGVSRLEPVGKPFDPNTQEAAAVVTVKQKRDDYLVMEEIEAGYMLGDKLLRPARVRVGRFDPT
jgi:molecular chaperone GrpE